MSLNHFIIFLQASSAVSLVRFSRNVVHHAYKVVATCHVLQNVTSSVFPDVNVPKDWFSATIRNVFRQRSAHVSLRVNHSSLARALPLGIARHGKYDTDLCFTLIAIRWISDLAALATHTKSRLVVKCTSKQVRRCRCCCYCCFLVDVWMERSLYINEYLDVFFASRTVYLYSLFITWFVTFHSTCDMGAVKCVEDRNCVSKGKFSQPETNWM